MTREVNCMNCMVGRFKEDLCDEKMCEALKRIGTSDDLEDIIMLAKEIVRCKDCDRGFGSPVCPIQSQGWAINTDTFYCAWGERKGGGDE